ncbi:hypothetical protein RRG08_012146 [Elysia crispata]|uniref:Uncharacterized protein n=1 Tax=Elysia crispata TaxID=231223 RepID=A0AAE0ZJD4_9GAST|nr:hypothetical protein RRG08_012146 [Elysia crispata]
MFQNVNSFPYKINHDLILETSDELIPLGSTIFNRLARVADIAATVVTRPEYCTSDNSMVVTNIKTAVHPVYVLSSHSWILYSHQQRRLTLFTSVDHNFTVAFFSEAIHWTPRTKEDKKVKEMLTPKQRNKSPEKVARMFCRQPWEC